MSRIIPSLHPSRSDGSRRKVRPRPGAGPLTMLAALFASLLRAFVPAVPATLLAWSMPAAAQQRYPIAIEAGPLSNTLRAIAQTTGLQIAIADSRTAQLIAPALKGRMTARAMLAAVVPAAGATYRFVARTTVLVRIAAPRPPRPSPPPIVAPLRILTGAGDIVVTAARREQHLSGLPLSVSAFSQAALDARGAATMADVARLTPGVVLRNGWGLSTNLSIRGIYSNSGSATIGVYLDDTPIQSRALGAGLTATNAYPALFDLDRVEIIQGPQGALFGSGSVGGTIRFITRAPDPDRYDVRGEVELRTTRSGAMSHEASVVLGGPLIGDRVGFRLSAMTRQDGGWVDRIDYSGRTAIQPNSNVTTTSVVRVGGAIKVGETVTLRPSVQVQTMTQGDTDLFWSPISDVGSRDFRNGASLAQPARDTFVVPSLRVDAELGAVSLSSSTSYFRRRRVSTMDYTNFLIEYLTQGQRFTLEEVPDYQAPVYFENDQDVFTQEVRLTSQGRGATRWIAGLFFQRARQDALEIISEPLLNEALLALTGRDVPSYFGSQPLADGVSYIGVDRSWDTQFAAFGQIEHDILSSVTLTVGGRLARTHFDQINRQDGPQSGGQLQSHIQDGAMPFLPRLSIAWRAFPSGMIYLSMARGSRIGGANPHVSPIRCGPQLARYGYSDVPQKYEADSIWNYEVGARTDKADGSFSLQASAYMFDWTNVQQNFSLRCLFRFTANSPSARGYGGDVALNWKPVPAVSLALSASYTHASYTQAAYGGVIDAQTGERAVLSTAGGPLPAPAFRLTGFLRHDFALGDLGQAYLSMSGEYASSYAVGRPPGAVGHDPLIYTLPSTSFLSLRAGLKRGPVEATLFVDNLMDAVDANQIGHTFPSSSNITMSTSRPRTIGINISYALQ
jgi:iron complex outermembrane receptor protein